MNMHRLAIELNSARVEIGLAIGEIDSIATLAQGRLNRALRLVGWLEEVTIQQANVGRRNVRIGGLSRKRHKDKRSIKIHKLDAFEA